MSAVGNSSQNSVSAYTRLPIGTVIRAFVTDTNPPKTKRFLIVGYTPDYSEVIVCYFNSEINSFQNFSAELQSLQIQMTHATRPYLSKLCYCDCARLYKKDSDVLHQYVQANPSIVIGTMDKADLNGVMLTLTNSTLLRGSHKKSYGFYNYVP